MIDYFNSRLDTVHNQAGAAAESRAEWSVDRVLELVQTFTQVGVTAVLQPKLSAVWQHMTRFVGGLVAAEV